MKVSELRPGMRRINIKGRITEIGEIREVMTKFGGMSRVVNATFEDDSGTVTLSLWNEDIDRVSVGDSVEIENGYITSFRGVTQLNVGRYGTLKTGKEENIETEENIEKEE
jgi:replication factor A1